MASNFYNSQQGISNFLAKFSSQKFEYELVEIEDTEDIESTRNSSEEQIKEEEDDALYIYIRNEQQIQEEVRQPNPVSRPNLFDLLCQQPPARSLPQSYFHILRLCAWTIVLTFLMALISDKRRWSIEEAHVRLMMIFVIMNMGTAFIFFIRDNCRE